MKAVHVERSKKVLKGDSLTQQKCGFFLQTKVFAIIMSVITVVKAGFDICLLNRKHYFLSSFTTRHEWC